MTIFPFLVFAGLYELIVEVLRMPRAPRFCVDGAYHHVYARIARGERVFGEDAEAPPVSPRSSVR